MSQQISDIISSAISLKRSIASDQQLLQRVQECVDVITEAFRNGNKVLFCGNGGSAADAQHLAAEFSGRFYIDREALPSEALHCNSSYLTAVANDYSYESIYSRIILGIGKEGDVLVALSTSGKSRNIVQALEAAKQKGLVTIGFTGEGGGDMKALCDLLLNVPSSDTPRIQEGHMLLGHIICQLVEANLFQKTT